MACVLCNGCYVVLVFLYVYRLMFTFIVSFYYLQVNGIMSVFHFQRQHSQDTYISMSNVIFIVLQIKTLETFD
jgi:hypothetical protein